MMDIGPLYIPFQYLLVGVAALLILLGVIGGSISRSRNARLDAERAEAVSARGWQHETLRHGNETIYRFQGTTNGVEWLVESRYVRSGDSASSHAALTRWTSKAADQGGIVELWPSRGGMMPTGIQLQPNSLLVRPLAKMLAGALSIPDLDAQRLFDVQPVQMNDALARHYTVLAGATANPTPILSAPSEQALIEYAEWASSREGKRSAGAPLTLILLWDGRLTILTQGVTVDPAVIERIAVLGTTLVNQLAA